MPLKKYQTRRQEAIIWVLFGCFIISYALYLFASIFIFDYVSFPSSNTKSSGSIVLDAMIIISMVLFGIYIFMMAWLRGTSLEIYSDHINVCEWYGSMYHINIDLPISITNYTFALHSNCQIQIPLPGDIYLIKINKNYVYVNMHDISDRKAEIESLESLLIALANSKCQ